MTAIIVSSVPLNLMKESAQEFFSSNREWRYTVTGGQYADKNGENVLLVVQDNLEALRLIDPSVSWATSGPKVSEAVAQEDDAVDVEQSEASEAQPESPNKAETYAEGTFQLRNIQGLELEMARNEAIEQLKSAGFKSKRPDYATGANTIERLRGPGTYIMLHKYFHSPDTFPIYESHTFEKRGVSIVFHTFPAGSSGSVALITRESRMAEPMHIDDILPQVWARAGITAHCSDANSLEIRLGYQLKGDWTREPLGATNGICTHAPSLTASFEFEKYYGQVQESERVAIQAVVTVGRRGSERLPTQHYNSLAVGLYASKYMTNSAIDSLNASRKAASEKASKKKVLDF